MIVTCFLGKCTDLFKQNYLYAEKITELVTYGTAQNGTARKIFVQNQKGTQLQDTRK